MPWGECKPKDMIIASAAPQSQHICVPEAPVFDPNCAKITLKFDMSKVPLVSIAYSRLSLSRLRLSRVNAYLEEKMWSFF